MKSVPLPPQESDAEDGGLVGLAMMGYLEDLLIDWFEDQLSGDLPEAAKQDLRGEFSEYFQLVRRDEDGELRAVAKGERRTAPIRAEISETEDRVERMETEQALRRGEKVEPTRVLAAAEAKRRPVEAREMPTAKAPGKGRNQRGKKR